MNEENLLPNDGSTFLIQEPAQRDAARKKEKAEALKAMPVIKAEVERLKKRISFRDSIDSIEVLVEDSPEVHQKTVLVNKAVKAELEEELKQLESVLSEYNEMSR